jgi:hypothetical protein
MSGLNLFELNAMLTEALQVAENLLDHETGEIPESWATFLDDVQMERDAKILGCAALYKSWRREADAIRTEEKALAARRHAVEARGERIKGWMVANMSAGEKLSDARCQLSWRTSPGSVVINNPSQIPEEFFHKEIVWHNKEIGDAIKSGATIPGADLVKSMLLQIK